MLRSLAVFLALAAACSGRKVTVAVDRQRDMDGAWVVADRRGRVHVDATGRAVTVRFQERTFVFPDLRSCRGVVSTEAVRLKGEGLAIDLTPERARIEGAAGVLEREMKALPGDREIVYVHGGLLYR